MKKVMKEKTGLGIAMVLAILMLGYQRPCYFYQALALARLVNYDESGVIVYVTNVLQVHQNLIS